MERPHKASPSGMGQHAPAAATSSRTQVPRRSLVADRECGALRFDEPLFLDSASVRVIVSRLSRGVGKSLRGSASARCGLFHGRAALRRRLQPELGEPPETKCDRPIERTKFHASR